MPNYKPLRQWVHEKQLRAENTLAFIKGLEDDIQELSKGLGARVRLVVES